VAGIGCFISGDLLFAGYLKRRNELLLKETIEKGTRPKDDVPDNMFVSRPLVIDRLKQILQSDRYHSNYYVVCGEHGTGKTTLTRIASRDVHSRAISLGPPNKL